MKCWTQAKLALPRGGRPNCQRGSLSLRNQVGVVEGRIGEDEVGAQIEMEIAPEGVGLLFAEIGFDAADGEVHHGEAAGGGVALLTVDADVAEPAAVSFDEFFRLHESRRVRRAADSAREPRALPGIAGACGEAPLPNKSMVPMRSMSSPSRFLSSAGRA